MSKRTEDYAPLFDDHEVYIPEWPLTAKSPIPYMGSKSKMRKDLQDMLPTPRPERMLSPFLGGASFELYMQAQGMRVVGNDAYWPLVCFWREVMDNPAGMFLVCCAIWKDFTEKETRDKWKRALNAMQDEFSMDDAIAFVGGKDHARPPPAEQYSGIHHLLHSSLRMRRLDKTADAAAADYMLRQTGYGGTHAKGGQSDVHMGNLGQHTDAAAANYLIQHTAFGNNPTAGHSPSMMDMLERVDTAAAQYLLAATGFGGETVRGSSPEGMAELGQQTHAAAAAHLLAYTEFCGDNNLSNSGSKVHMGNLSQHTDASAAQALLRSPAEVREILACIERVGTRLNRIIKFRAPNMSCDFMDWKEFLASHDERDFVFADPPYYKVAAPIYGKNGKLHMDFNHEEFGEAMMARPGKWLITYDDVPEVRRMFPGCDFQRHDMKWGGNRGWKEGNELIIRNY